MAFPFFYIEAIQDNISSIILNEETSKHVVQVLRMQNGEQLQLTDGRGNLFTATITDNHKRNCEVKILQTSNIKHQPSDISIAVSLIKNAHRFEWFLEKATEIGVTEIIPLICARTEKHHFRHDRMKGIIISAMLQSQQCWLPLLHGPVKLNEVISKAKQEQKFIAHCEDENNKVQLSTLLTNLPLAIGTTSKLILIGPEGDFTKEEIQFALQNNFTAVALGNTRLRTETAAVVSAALLCTR